MLAAILGFLTPFTSIFARFIRDKSAEKIAGEVTTQEKLRGEAAVGVAKEETKQSEDDAAVGAQNAQVATENTVGKADGGFFTNLNRVLRPLMTLAVLGFIAWFFIDPVSLTVWASKFAILPDWLWAVFSGIFAFWLGAPLAKFNKPAKVLTKAEAEAIVNPVEPVVEAEYQIEFREGDEPKLPEPEKPLEPAPQATTPAVKVITKPKPKPAPTKQTKPAPTKPVVKKQPPTPKAPVKKTNLKSKFN